MKITFPHMGHTWVVMKALLEHLDLDVVVPPFTSKKTLSLGVQHAPEFACLPFKVNLGNLIEARELGAEAFIMAGGVGPCRFGLYAQLEKEILHDLGYSYKSLILEPPDAGIRKFLIDVRNTIGNVSWWRVWQAIRLAYRKAYLLDQLERTLQEVRPRELIKGTADRIFAFSLGTIDRAKKNEEIEEAYGLAKQKLLHVPQNDDQVILKIGLVGEIYTLLEPFASMEIEKKLGYLGAHVDRSIYLSEWINEHLFRGLFGKKKGDLHFKAYAAPFLNHFVGGHGLESIGAGVAFAKKGYDGIVQVAPLTCMPEIVAHTIFPKVSENCGIPVLTIYVDEQMGQEGINTRLEAFIDLLRKRRTALDPQRTIC